jgi:hypothetical protein
LSDISCLSLIEAMNTGPIYITINKNVDQGKFKRIAVVPYDVSAYRGFGRTGGKHGGENLADMYSAELLKIGYDVIERTRLTAVVKELELQMTGLINPSTTSKIGKILGVQGMVFGTAAGRAGAWTCTSRLVDVETGSVVWTIITETNLPKYAVPRLKKELDKYFKQQGKR